MGFRWSPDDASMADGFRRIAGEQVKKAIASAKAHDLPPAKRIHDARRRGKKLRALIRLARRDFDAAGRVSKHVRDAAAGLSEARDASVMRQTLSGLMEWAGRPLPPPPPSPEDVEQEERVLQRFGDEMQALERQIDDWPVDRIDRDTVEAGLARTYRSARRAARQCNDDDASDEDFHEWRKLAKAHWYQLGLLRAAAGGILDSEIEAAGKLSDLLGSHHDLAVLRSELEATPRQFGVPVDAGFVDDAAKRRQRELETEARELGARVFAERPKALRERFAAYLDSWHRDKAAA